MDPRIREFLKGVKVATPSECEEAEFVLCADARPDSIRVGVTEDVPCGKCGRLVIFTTSSSPKKPIKICLSCAMAWIADEQSTAE